MTLIRASFVSRQRSETKKYGRENRIFDPSAIFVQLVWDMQDVSYSNIHKFGPTTDLDGFTTMIKDRLLFLAYFGLSQVTLTSGLGASSRTQWTEPGSDLCSGVSLWISSAVCEMATGKMPLQFTQITQYILV